MEQTLMVFRFIDILMLFVLFIMFGIAVWIETKSKYSMFYKLIRIGLETLLWVILISRLILAVSLNQSYGATVLLLCLWTFIIVIEIFCIGYEAGMKEILDENERNR